jgi:hypothetical protein
MCKRAGRGGGVCAPPSPGVRSGGAVAAVDAELGQNHVGGLGEGHHVLVKPLGRRLPHGADSKQPGAQRRHRTSQLETHRHS